MVNKFSKKIPAALKTQIKNEKILFLVKEGPPKSLLKTSIEIFFYFIWIIGVPIAIFQYYDDPTAKEPEPFWEQMIVLIFLGVIFIWAVWSLYIEIGQLLKKKAYFVATPKKLIEFFDNRTRTCQWHYFYKTIDVSEGKKRGDIILYAQIDKPGNQNKEKKILDEYGEEIDLEDSDGIKVFYMMFIKNPQEIAKICDQRIKIHG